MLLVTYLRRVNLAWLRRLIECCCRDCMCPVVLTRGADQQPVSTKFDMRTDPVCSPAGSRCSRLPPNLS